MAVTVRHLELNIWKDVHNGDTVSSAPVARLREQERCNPSLLGCGSMETHEAANPRIQKGEVSSAPWNNDCEDKSKKDKKWSIGKLFRRKKKESESESGSSDENSQKQSKKKKQNKKQRPSLSKNGFDEVDGGNAPNQRSQSVTKFMKKEYYDEGVLSDPSAGFVGYVGRGLPRSPFDRSYVTSKESLDKRGPESSCGSQDGSLRKGRKGRIKARVEAIRNLKNDSSSDEESQRSTSSSILRFRSDDSLANHSKGDLANKRTRSARTDRYIKRLSRDEEVAIEKESDLVQTMLNKADSESFSSRQRILSSPQINGLSQNNREEPEYYEPQKPYYSFPNKPERSFSGTQLTQQYNYNPGPLQNRTNLRPSTLTGSNSSVYSYPTGVINFNAKVNDENISYSVPYNSANKQYKQNMSTPKTSLYRNTSLENNNNIYSGQNYENDNVMVVKFPLGNVNTTKKEPNAPPVPPPRDPRKVPTPLSHMYDNVRPVSYNFDYNSQKNMPPKMEDNRMNINNTNNYMQSNVYENNIASRNGNNLTWMKRPISTSEDHIAMQQNIYNPTVNQYQNDQPKRPSSVTGETIRPDLYNRYLTRPQVYQQNTARNQNMRPTPEAQNQDYLYFADKTPRSRKPIHITPGAVNVNQQNINNVPMRPRNASEFWKKMDTQESQRRKFIGHNRTLSDQTINGLPSQIQTKKAPPMIAPIKSIPKPLMLNGETHKHPIIENRKFTQNVNLDNNISRVTKEKKEDKPICYSNIDIIPMDDIRKEKSYSGRSSDEDQSKSRRKSTNLDDALSELEAIYNSLGLGDEDLIDRAEKRELMTPKTTESFPFNNTSSKDNYFRYPSFSGGNESPGKRNQINRRSSIPDKLHDDMAFRRMNPHERPKSKDVNNLVSQVSYMLTSPVLGEPYPDMSKSADDTDHEEPDIILDDVVFRNIRQAKNYLKIEDPQPPFGIPIGFVSPSPYSNYLHAAPETKERTRHFDQDEPDVVTDDLAFRTLRKDCRNSSVTNDDDDINKITDLKNIQSSAIFDNHVIKKKRAVRSLSANIFTLIQKEIDDAIGLYSNRPMEKAQSIPDLPEAVVEFGKSGKLPNDFKSSQNFEDINKPQVSTRSMHFENEPREKAKSFQTKGLEEKIIGRPPIAIALEKSRGPTPTNNGSRSTKYSDGENKESNDIPKKLKENISISDSAEYIQYDKQQPIKVTIENKFKSDFHPSEKNKFIVDYSTKVYTSNPQTMVINSETNVKKESFFTKPVEVKSNVFGPKDHNKVNVEKRNDAENLESAGKDTENSLLEISNQLKKIGNSLKSNADMQENFEEEGFKLQALAKKCDINLNENLHYQSYDEGMPTYSSVSNSSPRKSPIKIESNPISSQELKNFRVNHLTNKPAPIDEPSCSKNEALEKMPSFEDLRKGINELLDGISQVTDRFNMNKSNELSDKKSLISSKDHGKESPIDDVIDKSKDSRGSPEYNSSEELAMIFNLNKEDSSTVEAKNADPDESHLDLNSPRLVNNANQTFIRKSSVERDIKEAECSKQTKSVVESESCSSDAPWRKHRRQPSTDNASKGNVQDHETNHRDEPYPSQKPLVVHSSSAFRPVKPSKSKAAPFVTPKNTSKFYRERPFFEDIKSIARGFGEIIEFSDRAKGVRRDGCNFGDDTEKSDLKYTSHGDLLSGLNLPEDLTKGCDGGRGRGKKIKRQPDRRVTVHNSENIFNESQSRIDKNTIRLSPDLEYFDMPEANIDNITSSIMGDSGKMERIRKYKEERRKQLAAQSSGQAPSKPSRLMAKKTVPSKTDDAGVLENGSTRKAENGTASSSSSKVRTTRTSRLRAAASAGDSPPLKAPDNRLSKNLDDAATTSPTPVDCLKSEVHSNDDNVFVDSTNVNHEVLSNKVVILGNSELDSESVDRLSRQQVVDDIKCDIDTVIRISESLSDRMTVSSSDDAPRRNRQTRANANGSPGPAGPAGATKQPARLRNKDNVGDESAARRCRLTSSRTNLKTENGPTIENTSINKSSVPKIKNGVHLKKASPRSSSQSPLSTVTSAKLQQKRRSVDLSPKALSVNNKPTELDLKPIVSNGLDHKKTLGDHTRSESASRLNNIKLSTVSKAKKVAENRRESTKTSGDSSSDLEVNRCKRRSSSLVTDLRNHNGTSSSEESRKNKRNMTPGVDKNLKQQNLPNVELDHKPFTKTSSVDNAFSRTNNKTVANRRLTSRMDALAALTKETLARVDRLARKKESENGEVLKTKNEDSQPFTNSKFNSNRNDKNLDELRNRENDLIGATSTSRRMADRLNDIDAVTQHLLDFEKQSFNDKHSEINRKQNEPLASMLSYTPVSILKRKSLQEEHGSSGASSGNAATPPVTFSPSVIDPRPSKSRRHGQGILKKRRSLDESQVNRHRSCSPEVAFVEDLRSRPILKSQRRSSLEEVIRGRSPDGQIQGILKRKCSRDGDFVEDRSLGSPEPQGILKRKSNSSSSSSTTSSHVSIAQAVILAAAKGAVLIEEKDGVRPILKKKSFSEERPCTEIYNVDCVGPKPILKKKSLTESDHSDHDRPTKTILKQHKFEDGNSSSFDHSEDDRSSRRSSMLRNKTVDGSESESSVRPILKQRGSSQSREHSQSPRPRLSFCSDDELTLSPEDVNQAISDKILNGVSPEISPQVESPQRHSEDDDLPKNSRFAGRLQSPSLVREFFNAACDNSAAGIDTSPHFPSVVLRRRDLRPRDANRSKSLVSSFSDELNLVLNCRRSLVDESCPDADNLSESSREPSPDKGSKQPKVAAKFPSIAERIQCMEQYLGKESTSPKQLGAVPKRQMRNKERFRTQPVTVDELQDIANLDVGQANFQRAGQATSANTVDNSFDSSPLDDENTLARRFLRSDPYTSSSTKNSSLYNNVDDESIPNLPGDFSTNHSTNELSSPLKRIEPLLEYRKPFAKLKSFDDIASPFSKVKSFTDLTFSPEHLNSFANLNTSNDDSSPVTREFNRLFKDYKRDSKNSESLNFSRLNWDLETQGSIDSYCSPKDPPPVVSDISLSSTEFNPASNRFGSDLNQQAKNILKRPNKLFDGETCYQEGSREAVLQELDRLENELEDVKVALDADSNALSGVDVDHWSLNVSVDSGVFHRMSSGDSGPLSGGEDLSLQQDVNKPSVVNKDLISPTANQAVFEKPVANYSAIITQRENPKEKEASFENMSFDMDKECDDLAADNPEDLFGLMKSNSVSARASMWQQMQVQANKAAVKPIVRHSRLKAKDGSPSVLERFKTQPITLGEVNNAVIESSPNPLNQSRSSFNLSLEQDEDAKLDENDPAKLTLAEKMKLFGAVIAPKPPSGPKKAKSPRFKTMPVLSSQVEDAKEMNKNRVSIGSEKLNFSLPVEKSERSSSLIEGTSAAQEKEDSPDENDKIVSVAERLNQFNRLRNSISSDIRVTSNDDEFKRKKEIGTNFRLAQNKLAEQASRMLTSEVRGILKSRSGAIPVLPTEIDGNIFGKQADSKRKNNIKLPPITKDKDEFAPKQDTKILTKGSSSEGLRDEGIDSSSDDDSVIHSSHSSGQSCTSSESSDVSDEEEESIPKEEKLLKPSQLKSSKTDSDIAVKVKVLRDNPKADQQIKLPCMDEMRARQIMERCMKSDKENLQKKPAVNQQPKKILKEESSYPIKTVNEPVNQSESAFVKLKNLKNGNVPTLKYSEDTSESDLKKDIVINSAPKFAPSSVSKSKSAHVFNSQLLGEYKLRGESGQESPIKLKSPSLDIGDGSGSDGESSGGREVRHINSRRRNLRGQQITPLAAALNAGGVPLQGLRRSATQPMAAAVPQHGGSIAERLKALQQSGNNDWRKRVSRLSPDEDVTNVITATKNKINETLTQQHEEKRRAVQVDPSEMPSDILISDRRHKLETSAQDWKKRVGPNDATVFSVAGRMDRDKAPPTPTAPLLPPSDKQVVEKKTPVAARFRSRRPEATAVGPLKSASSATVSQPASPHKSGIGEFRRSISVSGVDDLATDNNSGSTVMTKSQDGSVNGSQHVGPSVTVPRADDETFTSFFTSASQTVLTSSTSYVPYNNNNNEVDQINEDIDLDAIDSGTRHLLGGTGINRVRAARRAGGSRNPLRVLAARTDLRQEYTEPPSTGLADKETARLKKDKLIINSPMAIEALAGLASKEDFTSVNLKKTMGSSPPNAGSQTLSKPPLLIHVKGRRRVQARLVEPHYDSINSGDCFILVTPDQVFHYAGYYANVIERSRGAEIALHIHTTKDLGCVNSTSVITLDEQARVRSSRGWKQFWNLLGLEDADDYKPVSAGNADEDEIFESGIIPTNMCYEVIDDELVPIQEYWGQIPKIAMLDPSKILVFDFGSELYVWNGKNTILERRRMAFQLAHELWDEGYDYKDCIICPVNVPQVLGARTELKESPKKSNSRPEWAMITKVTQHMENILFRDKFLDWPDFSRVIKVKEEEESLKSGGIEIKPFDAEEMWKDEYENPSLELEGSHVGRGTYHYDKETMRHFEVKTKSITKWMIQDNDYVKINEEDLGEFYSADSYIVRWEYQLNVSGRELNGKPSKHNLTGRDRCAYFCWQGKDATANEKGTAALLTVELDHEKGPQVRVTQGSEHPAFLNLLKGSLVIHQGKKGTDKNRYRLYMARGNVANESHLIQVSCSMRQLRSRASMLLVDTEKGLIYVWHGSKSLKHTRSVAVEAANLMASKKHPDLFSIDLIDVKINEINEGDEPKSVIDALGGANRQLYHSLIEKDNKSVDSTAITPRLFHFTDLSGHFVANEILSPLRHESLVTPYPFSQQELYSASQPGLFLIDNGDMLWLWQGWMPQNGDSESTEAGVGSIRWQLCRRAAMETVLRYWEVSHPDSKEPQASLIVAGLEPLQFTNLFDIWQDRDDVTELNMMYGHKVGEGVCSVSGELCRLSRTSFPLAVLRQRPLPDGVDPANIERYLSAQQFEETFGMKKEEFYELPSWKQANMKKDLGLF